MALVLSVAIIGRSTPTKKISGLAKEARLRILTAFVPHQDVIIVVRFFF